MSIHDTHFMSINDITYMSINDMNIIMSTNNIAFM